jgi:hypothetical protein
MNQPQALTHPSVLHGKPSDVLHVATGSELFADQLFQQFPDVAALGALACRCTGSARAAIGSADLLVFHTV